MGKVKGTPRQGLTGATLGFFIGFAAVALFGPTAARFQQVMHLSPMAVGFLVAMPSLSGSLLRIPFSAWVDTTGGRKPFLVLLTLSVMGMAGLSAVAGSRPSRSAPARCRTGFRKRGRGARWRYSAERETSRPAFSRWSFRWR